MATRGLARSGPGTGRGPGRRCWVPEMRGAGAPGPFHPGELGGCCPVPGSGGTPRSAPAIAVSVPLACQGGEAGKHRCFLGCETRDWDGNTGGVGAEAPWPVSATAGDLSHQLAAPPAALTPSPGVMGWGLGTSPLWIQVLHPCSWEPVLPFGAAAMAVGWCHGQGWPRGPACPLRASGIPHPTQHSQCPLAVPGLVMAVGSDAAPLHSPWHHGGT